MDSEDAAEEDPVTSCPECGHTEQRVHGAHQVISYVRRWWMFGRHVPRATTVALDVSCTHCYYAFIVRPTGVTRAPLQTAHDSLKAAPSALVNGTQAKAVAEEKPAPRLVPRPAGDPRVRRH